MVVEELVVIVVVVRGDVVVCRCVRRWSWSGWRTVGASMGVVASVHSRELGGALSLGNIMRTLFGGESCQVAIACWLLVAAK